jgi:HEAT repeat protein
VWPGRQNGRKARDEIIMRKYALLFMLVLALLPGIAAAQVPVTGAPGATLSALTGSSTMVTVVLKESGARDANLRVLGKAGQAINFMNEDNEIIPYLVADIAEIEVQGGVVEKAEFKLDQSRALRPEEQIIFDRSLARAEEIFQESSANQDIKIEAATLMALSGNQTAVDYLVELANSNSVNQQLSAALGLYLAGASLPEGEVTFASLARKGLEGANRQGRAQGAQLAGLVGENSLVAPLLGLLQDRAANQCGPAAKALARLGARESIPQLLGLIESRTEEKGEAAQWALTRLGGEDVIEQLNIQIKNAQGFGKFRIAQVLYALGNEEGRREMQRVFREVFTLAVEAAKILAASGDFEAMGYLQGRVGERMDESDEGLIELVEMGGALLQGGDTTAQAVMQQVLRRESVPARTAVCRVIVETGNRRLMPLIQSSVESREHKLAIEACMAAVALGIPEFRARLLEARAG